MPYIVKYTLQRIALLILTTFIILTLTFFMIKLLPDVGMPQGDDAVKAFCDNQFNLGYYIRSAIERDGLGDPVFIYQNTNTGAQTYYYRRPIIEQYGSWIVAVFTKWDWGVSSSIQPNTSAMEIIMQRLGPTVLLNVVSMLISVPLGFVFGISSALNKNKPYDHIVQTIVMVLISVPSFVLISLLMVWLSFSTNLLPSAWPNEGEAIGKFISAMIIPVLALSFGTIAGFTRYTRAELCEVMSSEFLLLARTKGLNKRQCVIRHALRNSMVPLVPMIIGQFISVLSGSIVLEQLYSIPGIGQLFIDSINARDYNVLFVDMVLVTLIGLVANLFVDLSYGIVDPRIRMGAKA